MKPTAKLKAPHKIHILSWMLALDKDGYIPCAYKNCKFMAVSFEEMVSHFQYIDCKKDFPLTCETCKLSTDMREKLLFHNIYVHSYNPTAEEFSEVSRFLGIKKELTKNVRQSWQLFLDNKGYLKCLNRACLFVPSSLEEMEDHYLNSCKESFWNSLNFECEGCHGRFPKQELLTKHITRHHSFPRTEVTRFKSNNKTPLSELIQQWAKTIMSNKQATCPVPGCRFVINNVALLEKHYKSCNGIMEKNFLVCEICDNWLLDGKKLTEHMRCLHKDVFLQRPPQGSSEDTNNFSRRETWWLAPEENGTENDCIIEVPTKTYKPLVRRDTESSSRTHLAYGEFSASAISYTEGNDTTLKHSEDISNIQFSEDFVELKSLEVDPSIDGPPCPFSGSIEPVKQRKIETKNMKQTKRTTNSTSRPTTSGATPTVLEEVGSMLPKNSFRPIQIEFDPEQLKVAVNFCDNVVDPPPKKPPFPKTEAELYKLLRQDSLKLLSALSGRCQPRNDAKKKFHYSENKYIENFTVRINTSKLKDVPIVKDSEVLCNDEVSNVSSENSSNSHKTPSDQHLSLIAPSDAVSTVKADVTKSCEDDSIHTSPIDVETAHLFHASLKPQSEAISPCKVDKQEQSCDDVNFLSFENDNIPQNSPIKKLVCSDPDCTDRSLIPQSEAISTVQEVDVKEELTDELFQRYVAGSPVSSTSQILAESAEISCYQNESLDGSIFGSSFRSASPLVPPSEASETEFPIDSLSCAVADMTETVTSPSRPPSQLMRSESPIDPLGVPTPEPLEAQSPVDPLSGPATESMRMGSPTDPLAVPTSELSGVESSVDPLIDSPELNTPQPAVDNLINSEVSLKQDSLAEEAFVPQKVYSLRKRCTNRSKSLPCENVHRNINNEESDEEFYGFPPDSIDTHYEYLSEINQYFEMRSKLNPGKSCFNDFVCEERPSDGGNNLQVDSEFISDNIRNSLHHSSENSINFIDTNSNSHQIEIEFHDSYSSSEENIFEDEEENYFIFEERSLKEESVQMGQDVIEKCVFIEGTDKSHSIDKIQQPQDSEMHDELKEAARDDFKEILNSNSNYPLKHNLKIQKTYTRRNKEKRNDPFNFSEPGSPYSYSLNENPGNMELVYDIEQEGPSNLINLNKNCVSVISLLSNSNCSSPIFLESTDELPYLPSSDDPELSCHKSCSLRQYTKKKKVSLKPQGTSVKEVNMIKPRPVRKRRASKPAYLNEFELTLEKKSSRGARRASCDLEASSSGRQTYQPASSGAKEATGIDLKPHHNSLELELRDLASEDDDSGILGYSLVSNHFEDYIGTSSNSGMALKIVQDSESPLSTNEVNLSSLASQIHVSHNNLHSNPSYLPFMQQNNHELERKRLDSISVSEDYPHEHVLEPGMPGNQNINTSKESVSVGFDNPLSAAAADTLQSEEMPVEIKTTKATCLKESASGSVSNSAAVDYPLDIGGPSSSPNKTYGRSRKNIPALPSYSREQRTHKEEGPILPDNPIEMAQGLVHALIANEDENSLKNKTNPDPKFSPYPRAENSKNSTDFGNFQTQANVVGLILEGQSSSNIVEENVKNNLAVSNPHNPLSPDVMDISSDTDVSNNELSTSAHDSFVSVEFDNSIITDYPLKEAEPSSVVLKERGVSVAHRRNKKCEKMAGSFTLKNDKQDFDISMPDNLSKVMPENLNKNGLEGLEPNLLNRLNVAGNLVKNNIVGIDMSENLVSSCESAPKKRGRRKSLVMTEGIPLQNINESMILQKENSGNLLGSNVLQTSIVPSKSIPRKRGKSLDSHLITQTIRLNEIEDISQNETIMLDLHKNSSFEPACCSILRGEGRIRNCGPRKKRSVAETCLHGKHSHAVPQKEFEEKQECLTKKQIRPKRKESLSETINLDEVEAGDVPEKEECFLGNPSRELVQELNPKKGGMHRKSTLLSHISNVSQKELNIISMSEKYPQASFEQFAPEKGGRTRKVEPVFEVIDLDAIEDASQNGTSDELLDDSSLTSAQLISDTGGRHRNKRKSLSHTLNVQGKEFNDTPISTNLPQTIFNEEHATVPEKQGTPKKKKSVVKIIEPDEIRQQNKIAGVALLENSSHGSTQGSTYEKGNWGVKNSTSPSHKPNTLQTGLNDIPISENLPQPSFERQNIFVPKKLFRPRKIKTAPEIIDVDLMEDSPQNEITGEYFQEDSSHTLLQLISKKIGRSISKNRTSLPRPLTVQQEEINNTSNSDNPPQNTSNEIHKTVTEKKGIPREKKSIPRMIDLDEIEDVSPKMKEKMAGEDLLEYADLKLPHDSVSKEESRLESNKTPFSPELNVHQEKCTKISISKYNTQTCVGEKHNAKKPAILRKKKSMLRKIKSVPEIIDTDLMEDARIKEGAGKYFRVRLPQRSISQVVRRLDTNNTSCSNGLDSPQQEFDGLSTPGNLVQTSFESNPPKKRGGRPTKKEPVYKVIDIDETKDVPQKETSENLIKSPGLKLPQGFTSLNERRLESSRSLCLEISISENLTQTSFEKKGEFIPQKPGRQSKEGSMPEIEEVDVPQNQFAGEDFPVNFFNPSIESSQGSVPKKGGRKNNSGYSHALHASQQEIDDPSTSSNPPHTSFEKKPEFVPNERSRPQQNNSVPEVIDLDENKDDPQNEFAEVDTPKDSSLGSPQSSIPESGRRFRKNSTAYSHRLDAPQQQVDISTSENVSLSSFEDNHEFVPKKQGRPKKKPVPEIIDLEKDDSQCEFPRLNLPESLRSPRGQSSEKGERLRKTSSAYCHGLDVPRQEYSDLSTLGNLAQSSFEEKHQLLRRKRDRPKQKTPVTEIIDLDENKNDLNNEFAEVVLPGNPSLSSPQRSNPKKSERLMKNTTEYSLGLDTPHQEGDGQSTSGNPIQTSIKDKHEIVPKKRGRPKKKSVPEIIDLEKDDSKSEFAGLDLSESLRSPQGQSPEEGVRLRKTSSEYCLGLDVPHQEGDGQSTSGNPNQSSIEDKHEFVPKKRGRPKKKSVPEIIDLDESKDDPHKELAEIVLLGNPSPSSPQGSIPKESGRLMKNSSDYSLGIDAHQKEDGGQSTSCNPTQSSIEDKHEFVPKKRGRPKKKSVPEIIDLDENKDDPHEELAEIVLPGNPSPSSPQGSIPKECGRLMKNSSDYSLGIDAHQKEDGGQSTSGNPTQTSIEDKHEFVPKKRGRPKKKSVPEIIDLDENKDDPHKELAEIGLPGNPSLSSPQGSNPKKSERLMKNSSDYSLGIDAHQKEDGGQSTSGNPTQTSIEDKHEFVPKKRGRPKKKSVPEIIDLDENKDDLHKELAEIALPGNPSLSSPQGSNPKKSERLMKNSSDYSLGIDAHQKEDGGQSTSGNPTQSSIEDKHDFVPKKRGRSKKKSVPEIIDLEVKEDDPQSVSARLDFPENPCLRLPQGECPEKGGRFKKNILEHSFGHDVPQQVEQVQKNPLGSPIQRSFEEKHQFVPRKRGRPKQKKSVPQVIDLDEEKDATQKESFQVDLAENPSLGSPHSSIPVEGGGLRKSNSDYSLGLDAPEEEVDGQYISGNATQTSIKNKHKFVPKKRGRSQQKKLVPEIIDLEIKEEDNPLNDFAMVDLPENTGLISLRGSTPENGGRLEKNNPVYSGGPQHESDALSISENLAQSSFGDDCEFLPKKRRGRPKKQKFLPEVIDLEIKEEGDSQNMNKIKQEEYEDENACLSILDASIPLPMKRGRPKKNVIDDQVKNNDSSCFPGLADSSLTTPNMSMLDDGDTGGSSSLQPLKKKRGRPKKTSLSSNDVSPGDFRLADANSTPIRDRGEGKRRVSRPGYISELWPSSDDEVAEESFGSDGNSQISDDAASPKAKRPRRSDVRPNLMEDPEKQVKCAVCQESMSAVVYYKQHLPRHNFIAWLEGEDPLPVDDIQAMVTVLTRAKKSHPKFIFTCEQCKQQRLSAKGFLTHRRFCGMTEEEIQKYKEQELQDSGQTPSPSSANTNKNKRIKRSTFFYEDVEDSPEEKSVQKSRKIPNWISDMKDQNRVDFIAEAFPVKPAGVDPVEDLTPRQLRMRLLSGRIDCSTKLKEPNKEVKCAVCGETMTAAAYQKVHLLKHNFMAWLEGEEPLPLNDTFSMTNILQRGKKKHPRFIFKCETCKKESKSGQGFLSHRQVCGRSLEEKEKILIPCPYCGRLMLPLSMPSHMYHSHRVESSNDNDTGVGDNSCAEEVVEEDENSDQLKKLYTVALRRPSKNLKNLWKRLETNGEQIKCTFPNCSYETWSAEDIYSHFKNCPCDSLSFCCIKCNYTNVNEEEIRLHAQNCNPLENVYSADSSDDDAYERRTVPFMKMLESGPRLLKYDFHPSLYWTKEWIEKTISREPVFQDFNLRWAAVSSSASNLYKPEEGISMPILYKEQNWTNLKAYSGKVLEGGKEGVAFTGGPIWGMAWCPSAGDQYLGVSSHHSMDVDYQIGSTYVGPGLLQIWAVGNVQNSHESKLEKLEFAYGICHEEGGCWDMVWCPGGGEVSNRLGLVALATTSGTIPVFAVPRPEALPLNQSRHFKMNPAVKLVLPGTEKWQCSAISWSKKKPHRLIAAGFVNGIVGIWDLSSKSSLLRTQQGYLRAYKVFQAHSSFVTGLSLSPETEGYLCSAGFDKTIKFWSLDDTSAPQSVSTRGLPTSLTWLRNWMMAASTYDIAYTMSQTTINLSSIRGFAYTNTQVMSTTSATSWSVSSNDWLNGLAASYENGQVVACFSLRHHLISHKERKKFSKVILQSHLRELPMPSTSKENSSAKTSHFSSSSYEQSRSKFGLEIKTDLNVTESSQDSLKENTHEAPIDIYPFTSVNKVAWSPNQQSFTYVAMGYQSGFLVISKICVKGAEQYLIDVASAPAGSQSKL